MGRLLRATDNYTAALQYSTPPSPPSWQQLSYKPAQSLSRMSSDVASRIATAKATTAKPALGDVEGVMDALMSAKKYGIAEGRMLGGVPGVLKAAKGTYSALLSRGLQGFRIPWRSAGTVPASAPLMQKLNGFGFQPTTSSDVGWTSAQLNLQGMEGVMDDIKDAAGGLVGNVNAKLDELDIALKVIIGLSSIAALTGVVTVFRR